MQIYHANARTNVHIRKEIAKNSAVSCKKLSEKWGVSVPTILKWKQRESPVDRSSRPHRVYYAMPHDVEALAVSIRRSTWFSVDEIHDMLKTDVSRSTLYRVFKRHHINQLPKEEKEKVKKFKEYEPGYIHIDVTYLPRIEGVKSYLFVAIDRATRLLFFKVYEKKSSENAKDFLKKCVEFFPFKIEKVLTDNGLEFSNRLLKSKKGNLCMKASLFDEVCEKNNIEHRLIKPCTPKTNGMVERVNGLIKSATVGKFSYSSVKEMKQELEKYMYYYNTTRRHGSLQRELGVRTPVEAARKWANMNENIFLEKKDFLLILNNYCKQRGGM